MSLVATSDVLPAWVGTPPDGWDTRWLKWDVSLRADRPSEEEAEALPYISNEDIASWTGQLLKAELSPAYADGRKFLPDDVLFNKLRPYLAKVFHAPFEGISSSELLCLRSSKGVLPRYLFYVVSSKAFIDAVNAETFGSKMPRADWEIVGHQPLPLPPFETQERIAAFLDEKMAQIDGLIAKKQALLECLAEKRQAIITQAVTKGLNPAAPMKDSGIDWLGQIPAHWEVVLLKRLKSFLTSGSRGWGDYYADDGDIFLRMTNVTKRGVEINDDDLRFVRLDGITEGKRTATKTGDILITITAELGSVAIVRDAHSGAFINQHLALFRADKAQCEPDFLVNFLWSDATKAQFELSGQGGTKQGLGFDQVDNVIIAVPPLIEQRQIVPAVAAVRSSVDAVEEAVRRSLERLIEYRSALISSAVTGQLSGIK